MKQFRGTQHSGYQHVLRALGAFIDQHGYTDIRILETEEGMIVQGRNADQQILERPGFDTHLITDDDIETLIRDAAQRRQPPAQPA